MGKGRNTNPRGRPENLIPLTPDRARQLALAYHEKRRQNELLAKRAILEITNPRATYGQERLSKVRKMCDRLDELAARELVKPKPDMELVGRLADAMSRFTTIEASLEKRIVKPGNNGAAPQPIVLGAETGV